MLSVVIPAYNEAERLPVTVEKIRDYLLKQNESFELILVDDGSADRTQVLMEELSEALSEVRMVALEQNRGKGRAIAEGVRVARGERILFSDADLSTPIEELFKLEQALEAGADIAIGSRAIRGGAELEQHFYRRVMGRTLNLLVRIVLLRGLLDTQCGFKLFRAEVAHSLFEQLYTDGFAFDIEILRRAQQAGYRIAEVPVSWFNSESSRVSPIRHSFQVLRDLAILRLR
ncbi:MAG: dolichyl-phosphate beta-glucosyltransferase [Candidatus Dormibacteraceae bacterium]